jgi:hypothetical protein
MVSPMRNRDIALTRVRLTVLGAALAVLSITGLATTRGPDSGGYTATDETVFSFIDVSTSGGASILTGTDDGSAALTLPFPFEFYGASYSMVCVSSNGAAYFINALAECGSTIDFANIDLSSTASPGDRPGLFPLWMDLKFEGVGAGLVYQTLGDAGSRKFVLQWKDARPVTADAPLTFEAILNEGSNQILFQYKTVGIDGNPATNGGQATVGIRAANGHVTLRQIPWSFNASVLADGKAILFAGGRSEPTVSVTGGTFSYNGTPHSGTGSAYGTGGVGDALTPVTVSYAGTGTTVYPLTLVAPTDAGTYEVTASFAGNASYTSGSGTASLTIVPASQTLNFTSTPPASPMVGGPAYVVTATGGGSGNPVTFSSQSASCTVSGSTVSFTGVGSCVVAANQQGSNNYNQAAQVTQSMAVAAGGSTTATTTSLISSGTSSEFSDPVVFVASVRRAGALVGTGTVTFKDGTTVLAVNVPVNALGLASFASSSLAVGVHTIAAFYNGTTTYGPSNGSVTQTVTKASTKAQLVSSRNPANKNQAVTFTLTVTRRTNAVATGTVMFRDGNTIIGGPIAVDASGTASFSTTSLAPGSHVITATYNGTSDYQGSSASLTQVMKK